MNGRDRVLRGRGPERAADFVLNTIWKGKAPRGGKDFGKNDGARGEVGGMNSDLAGKFWGEKKKKKNYVKRRTSA